MALRFINNRPYYYRGIREGGRVRTEYVARGDMALFLAAVDAEGRADAEDDERLERQAWDAERGALEAEERLVAGYVEAIDGAAGEALQDAGYHRPSRHRRWARKQS